MFGRAQPLLVEVLAHSAVYVHYTAADVVKVEHVLAEAPGFLSLVMRLHCVRAAWSQLGLEQARLRPPRPVRLVLRNDLEWHLLQAIVSRLRRHVISHVFGSDPDRGILFARRLFCEVGLGFDLPRRVMIRELRTQLIGSVFGRGRELDRAAFGDFCLGTCGRPSEDVVHSFYFFRVGDRLWFFSK